MTTIESKKVLVKATSQEVFDFLSDMNNIERLLPEGKVSEWKSTKESCSFKVQNAYTIGLNFHSSQPTHSIRYSSAQGSPFPFSLEVKLNEQEGSTEGYLHCEADINPFLKMMVVGPLKALFDYMADRLVVQFPAA